MPLSRKYSIPTELVFQFPPRIFLIASFLLVNLKYQLQPQIIAITPTTVDELRKVIFDYLPNDSADTSP